MFVDLIKEEIINKSSDYKLDYLQDGPFVIELFWGNEDTHTYRNIWYCPFCGTQLTKTDNKEGNNPI